MAYSKNIEAFYKVDILPTSELADTNARHFSYYAKVKVNYVIQDIQDTNLIFSAKSLISELGISNLKLQLLDSNGLTISKSNYDHQYENGVLRINYSNKNTSKFTIECEYTYIGDALISTIKKENFNMKSDPIRSNIMFWGGEDSFEQFTAMYFSNEKYKIINKSFSLSVPRSYYGIHSLLETSKSNEKENTISDCTFFHEDININKEAIICILDTLAYKEFTFNTNSNAVRLYVRKDSLKIYAPMIDTILNTFEYINQYSSAFIGNANVDIVEFHYQLDSTMAMGRAFNNTIFVDGCFMHKSYRSLIHEYLHTKVYFPIQDSCGCYFIGESMIEFLAKYFVYRNNPIKYDSVYRALKTAKLSINNANNKISLYGITIVNEDNADLVYSRGPVIIYDFAKKIGEENFIKVLFSFYKKYNTYNAYTYRDFIQYLRDSKIEKLYIDELDRQVKEIYN
jgi:hypothetical protein